MTMKHHMAVRGALSLAALLQAVPCVRAQTLLDTVTLYQEPSIRPPADTPVAEPQVQPGPRLRYMPALAQPARFDGEQSQLEWSLAMTTAEARTASQFQVAYRSAASVLPHVSRLALYINGTAVGRVAIAAPGDVKPVTFSIPRDALREGWNSIRMVAEQRHRVDCSAEATYELWTDIDPARTGFVIDESQPTFKLGDLAALRHRADGALAIRVRSDGPMSPARLDQTIRAAQAIALIGQHQRVVITLADDSTATDGITLNLGVDIAQPSVVLTGGPMTAVVSRLRLRQDNPALAPTLQIPGRSDDEIAQSVAELVARAEASKPPSGSADLNSGETRSLLPGDAKEMAFTGHAARYPIAFNMPFDLLATDYDRLTLDLAGSTQAGMPAGAQMRIRLNGRDAGSVPLPASSTFRQRGIAIPLGSTRPGRNVIEIAATIADGGDPACGNNISLDQAAPRLTLSETSRLHVPELARIGQFPSLSQFAAGGFPFAIPNLRPKLYVPNPDKDSIAAAMTLAVQLAIVARHAIAFETVIGNPGTLAGHGLLVAPARALDPNLLHTIGLNSEAIRQVWENRTEPSSGAAEHKPVVAASGGWSVSGTLATTLAYAQNWTGHVVTIAPERIDPAASLIVAQGARSDSESDTITVVTAPNAEELRRSVTAWATPQKWSEQSGRIAILDQSADVIDTVAAAQVHFIDTRLPTLQNTRLVLAGWLSLHPTLYALSALLMSAFLAFATRSLVRNVGRRNVQ